MKTLVVLLSLAPVGALAASPFDGTWKVRPESLHASGRPYVLVVDQNEFRCASCTPSLSVKPDGQFHEVSGHAFDSRAVKIVDPRSIEVIDRKNGKVLEDQTFVASQNGKQLRVRVVDESGERPSTSSYVLNRSVGNSVEEGKHAVSGSWVLTSMRQTTIMPTTFKMTEDGFSWSHNGQHYEAKFDGGPVAIEGDPTHTMASVRKLGANKVQETDTLNGRTVDESVYEVSPDGKSLTLSDTDASGHKVRYVYERVP